MQVSPEFQQDPAALSMLYVLRMLRLFKHRGYVTRYS